MTFVLDASVALSHCLGEPEFRDQAQNIIQALQTTTARVPVLWRFEFLNGLVKAERKKNLLRSEVQEITERWARMPVRVDTLGAEHLLGPVLSLAYQHSLSVYDAAYLELAVREKLSVATFDEALREAVRREGLGWFDGLR